MCWSLCRTRPRHGSSRDSPDHTQLRDKLNVDQNFTCVFTDSWSQTADNVEDPVQQEHWRTETDILWEITTDREDAFGFKTIDDILEEVALLKEENKWLNDIIHNNITQLTEMIQRNTENIQDNSDDIVSTNGRVDENKAFIEQNTANIDENEMKIDVNADIIDKLHIAPIGTISAWVTKPTKETREDKMVRLPEGWVRCDGKTIPKPSVWAGQRTPNLNGEKRFLRGGSDSKVLTMEGDQMQDHKHKVSDPGHTHSYVDKYPNYGGSDNGRYGPKDSDKSKDRWDKSHTSSTSKSKSTGITVQGVSPGFRFGSETRPKNMNVIYIMRVW